MWRALLTKATGALGGFLASKALSLVLIAALGAAGTYIAHVIKDRGSLEEKIKAEQRKTARAKAEARVSQENAREILAIARKLDAIDEQLRVAKEERERDFQVVNETIAGISIEFPEVRDFLDRPAPAALVRVLCDDGTIDPRSADCAALDSGAISGEL